MKCNTVEKLRSALGKACRKIIMFLERLRTDQVVVRNQTN